jgi:uncharacterized Zn finger protein
MPNRTVKCQCRRCGKVYTASIVKGLDDKPQIAFNVSVHGYCSEDCVTAEARIHGFESTALRDREACVVDADRAGHVITRVKVPNLWVVSYFDHYNEIQTVHIEAPTAQAAKAKYGLINKNLNLGWSMAGRIRQALVW